MISGTGRSGTNITKKIFSKHSRFAHLPFEFRFIIDPDGVLDFYNSFTSTWSPYYADKKIKRLERYLKKLSKENTFYQYIDRLIKRIDPGGLKITPRAYSGWALSKWIPAYNNIVNELIEKIKIFEYPGRWPGSNSYTFNNKMCFSDNYKSKDLLEIIKNFIDNIATEILRSQRKEVFVEDNTWNILHAEQMLEFIPNSFLVHIYRDPRDVVASFIKQKWCPNDLWQAIRYYKSLINRWLEVKNEINPERFIEIKFEDFVINPELNCKEVCKRIGIDFEKEMLKVNLSKSNTGRWKEEFSDPENKFLNESLKDIILLLGYNY